MTFYSIFGPGLLSISQVLGNKRGDVVKLADRVEENVSFQFFFAAHLGMSNQPDDCQTNLGGPVADQAG